MIIPVKYEIIHKRLSLNTILPFNIIIDIDKQSLMVHNSHYMLNVIGNYILI